MALGTLDIVQWPGWFRSMKGRRLQRLRENMNRCESSQQHYCILPSPKLTVMAVIVSNYSLVILGWNISRHLFGDAAAVSSDLRAPTSGSQTSVSCTSRILATRRALQKHVTRLTYFYNGQNRYLRLVNNLTHSAFPRTQSWDLRNFQLFCSILRRSHAGDVQYVSQLASHPPVATIMSADLKTRFQFLFFFFPPTPAAQRAPPFFISVQRDSHGGNNKHPDTPKCQQHSISTTQQSRSAKNTPINIVLTCTEYGTQASRKRR
ncbi:hypothetical protein ACRALDRAFT_1092773 [Sodiomyces alcalophilus JCM 7366]|uniref:uncharacterized protein n=1 Tax=Sodiomyces alcalophilus JCM 7366 TaxID=591952 RepID=UPI0039B6298A